jgi:pyrimidine and pyridine-specific 5'-nucleotidase
MRTSLSVPSTLTNPSDKYFQTHLSLPQSEANALHMKYYHSYGLAIEGLVRHHQVDALEFNSKVDDAVPLEDFLKPDAKLQALLGSIDAKKVKLWLLTNAHVTHGKRVVRLLGVDGFFEGITYCDYEEAKEKGRLLAKPHRDMWVKAMKQAGVSKVEDCYFVGEFNDRFLCCYASTDADGKMIHISMQRVQKKWVGMLFTSSRRNWNYLNHQRVNTASESWKR